MRRKGWDFAWLTWSDPRWALNLVRPAVGTRGGRGGPRRVESANGIRFADLVTLAIDVDVKDPFPLPRAGSTEITQADFPAIIEAVRQKVFRTLGAGSDRPEREVP